MTTSATNNELKRKTGPTRGQRLQAEPDLDGLDHAARRRSVEVPPVCPWGRAPRGGEGGDKGTVWGSENRPLGAESV